MTSFGQLSKLLRLHYSSKTNHHCPAGERFWGSSSSPGRERVSFYGIYLYNLGQVRIFPYDTANQFNTLDVLKKLRVEFPDMPLKVLWDGHLTTGPNWSTTLQTL